MLKIIAIGNLTNDVVLKTHEYTGKPYAVLRLACDRRYKDHDGNRLTDFISAKVHGRMAERCAEMAFKGCKIAVAGDFETIVFEDDPARQPGFSSRRERSSSCRRTLQRKPKMRSKPTRMQPDRL